MARHAVWAPPRTWEFNAADSARYGRRFWRCPTRLVRSGAWSDWWREAGSKRGGGAIASLLPVLALHTWPDSVRTTSGVLTPAFDATTESGNNASNWTGWGRLSHRRMCRLAGLSLETVGATLRRLETLGMLQRRPGPRHRYVGGPTTQEYRLQRSLYPNPSMIGGITDRYAGIEGNLIYGGLWQAFPTSAARNLLVVLACMDPVLNEGAFAAHLEGCHHPDAESPESLEELRRRNPLSIAELADLSGMTRATTTSALQIVMTPITVRSDGGSPERLHLVVHGPADGDAGQRGVRWFGVDQSVARTISMDPGMLNDPHANAELRKSIWADGGRRRPPPAVDEISADTTQASAPVNTTQTATESTERDEPTDLD